MNLLRLIKLLIEAMNEKQRKTTFLSLWFVQ